jgi:hypothetical protein
VKPAYNRTARDWIFVVVGRFRLEQVLQVKDPGHYGCFIQSRIHCSISGTGSAIAHSLASCCSVSGLNLRVVHVVVIKGFSPLSISVLKAISILLLHSVQ